MNPKPLTLAIIGGGAAGLMATATLCEKNPETHVLLIDKNAALGQKILLTGGGRCNLTTALIDPHDVLAHYPRGSRFLRFAMHEFSPQNVYEWFESHGVPLKTEERFRVFPQSDQARDVVAVFEKIFEAYPDTVRVLLGHSVKKIEKTKKGFSIEFEKNLPLLVDRVLITTGGKVQPAQGSASGHCALKINSFRASETPSFSLHYTDGYTLAASLGHTIMPLAPGLQALCLAEPWVRDLAGLAFPKARLTLTVEKNVYSSIGPFLFTHEGVSGPAVFALSSQAAYENFSAQNPALLCIDFFPDENFEQLSSRLKAALQEHPHQTLKNTLRLFGLRTFKEVLLWILGISGDKRNDQVSKKEILRLVEMLKRTPCHAIGRKSGEEIVTAGGVALDEVDSKTMASKKCPGLFLAGELLDLDAETGGFNLQAAWATGRVAGGSIKL